MDPSGIGPLGEEAAEKLLLACGMSILARNWRCRLGELDIVARDGDQIVFCEVKTRSGDAFGEPREAVDSRKLRRLTRLAAAYLGPRVDETSIRFDVVEVSRDHSGYLRAEHLRAVEDPSS